MKNRSANKNNVAHVMFYIVVNPEQETYTEKEKNIPCATLLFICRPVSHHHQMVMMSYSASHQAPKYVQRS